MITPKRPYLIRAFHEWMQDNDYTPYLMIDATHNDLHAPLQYAQDGRLVLAASYQATTIYRLIMMPSALLPDLAVCRKKSGFRWLP